MNYLVKRGDQEYGPYTLSDLQEYVASGHLFVTDIAKSEGMDEWVPVSQVLGNVPSPQRAAVEPSVPEARALVPLPPNLHWLILLILVVVTRQLFNFIWALVLANWARRLTGNNKTLVLIAMYPAAILAGGFTIGLGAVFGSGSVEAAAGVGGLLMLAGFICYLYGIFSIKTAMEEYYNSTEQIGLTLSGVMTFFFSSIYLQYHVNKIAKWKKTGGLY